MCGKLMRLASFEMEKRTRCKPREIRREMDVIGFSNHLVYWRWFLDFSFIMSARVCRARCGESGPARVTVWSLEIAL